MYTGTGIVGTGYTGVTPVSTIGTTGLVGTGYTGGYTGGYTEVIGTGYAGYAGQGNVVNVIEEVIPETVYTTAEKFIEIPEMIVRKERVVENVETIVERKQVRKIIEVPEVQTVVERVEVQVPQIQVQEIVKTVAKPFVETQTVIV
eukprot:CAMPEP_0169228966 /NCGR_PEP_ID=MMETSP1016-20121227/25130_1 /TAXON_ID=342587 /ORGANISM="Karlodinium micrum, Strain CCMP2283" /LENGTH=145 /DNA_ID=CAMNT_0009307809 /DNA_START=79 /DNA_END=513 /DNA_ORIENTATION=+